MGRAAPRPRAAAEGAPLLDPLLRRAPPAREKRGRFERLLAALVRRGRALGVLTPGATVAVDATGLETGTASAYYTDRRGGGAGRYRRRRWPKLTAVVDTASHFILGAVATTGPSQDSAQFARVVRQAARLLPLARLLGDAGYDAEQNHALCRERLGIRRTVIALNPRGTGRKWPRTRYRRQMKRRWCNRLYGQRWQAESGFSRHKRRLGAALTARRAAPRRREVLLRVLTHDLMILHRRRPGFQQSK